MMQKTPIAYFARHGTTEGNAAGIFRGAADIPLNDKGKQDAKDLGKWFENKPVSAVYSSELSRAKDTAEAIANPKQLKVKSIPALKSIDVGYLSGELKEDHKHVMDYFDKNPNERIPQGESINGFRGRTQPHIKAILVEGAKASAPVVAVVHSSIIHELNHIVSGDHNQNLVKPGGVVGVYHHTEHGLKVKALLKPEVEKEGEKYHG